MDRISAEAEAEAERRRKRCDGMHPVDTVVMSRSPPLPFVTGAIVRNVEFLVEHVLLEGTQTDMEPFRGQNRHRHPRRT